MAQPIQVVLASGEIVYVVIKKSSDGKFWNTDTELFETFNAANWANYAVALTEIGATGIYVGTYPAEIGATLTTEIAFAQVDPTPDTPAITDQPSVGSGSSQGVNLYAVAGSVLSAQIMALVLGAQYQAAVDAGTVTPTTTSCGTTLTGTVNNAYNGRIIIWTSGVLTGQVAKILAYNATTKTLTFTGVTNAPANADEFVIL